MIKIENVRKEPDNGMRKEAELLREELREIQQELDRITYRTKVLSIISFALVVLWVVLYIVRMFL